MLTLRVYQAINPVGCSCKFSPDFCRLWFPFQSLFQSLCSAVWIYPACVPPSGLSGTPPQWVGSLSLSLHLKLFGMFFGIRNARAQCGSDSRSWNTTYWVDFCQAPLSPSSPCYVPPSRGFLFWCPYQKARAFVSLLFPTTVPSSTAKGWEDRRGKEQGVLHTLAGPVREAGSSPSEF